MNTADRFRDLIDNHPDLTAPEWAAGQALASCLGDAASVRVTIALLAGKCRLGQSTVRRAMDGLEEKHLIKRQHHRANGRFTTTTYLPALGAGDGTSARSERMLDKESLSLNERSERALVEPTFIYGDGSAGGDEQPATPALEAADGATDAACGDVIDRLVRDAYEEGRRGA